MKIFLELPNRNVFAFNVSKNDKIMNFKNVINKLFGSILQNCILNYEDRILDDDKMFYEYKIEEKSLINVDRCEDMIFVERNRKELLGLKLETLTVSDLMKKIYDKIGIIEDDQILIYENVILEDDGKLLRECGISGNSVIRVLNRSREELSIFIRTIDVGMFVIDTQKLDKIIYVKYKIRDKIGLHPDEQILIYQGGILEDERTIDEYQICEKSVVDFDVKLRPDGMQIFVKTLDGKDFPIKVQRSDKIINLKYEMQQKIGLQPDKQKFIYQEKILNDDNKTIDEYQICDQSVINIVPKLRDELIIIAETFDRKQVIFKVEKSNKIIDIKTKIQEKLGLHPDYQKLKYQNKILNDDERIIDEYGICDGDVIDISLNLRGGGMQISVRVIDIETVIWVLEEEKSGQIKNLKYKIKLKTGWPLNKQILIYQGVILDDNKTIDEYGICEKSIINAVHKLRNEMVIFANIFNGNCVPIEIDKSDKIIYIKNIIQEKIGLNPDGQKLNYQGKILDNDDKTIDDYQICDQSVINVVARLSFEMKRVVKTIGVNLHPLDAEKSDEGFNIIKKFQSKIGLNRGKQVLGYQRLLFNDESTIDEYEYSGHKKVVIELSDGTIFSIGVSTSDKIGDIKYKIKRKKHLNLDRQLLICQGGILSDDKRTVDEYGICDGDVINVTDRMSDKILVFAEIIKGEPLTFPRPINSTIGDMKNEIIAKLGLTKSDEILIYHDNILDDDNKSINRYQSNMILILTIRTKYDKSFTIDLSEHDNIREIMKSIKTKLEIHKKYEKIIFNNKQLLTNNNNNKVVYSFEIVPRSIIDLDCELREFRLFIRSIKKGSLDDVKQHFQKEYLEKTHGSYLRFPIHYAVRYGHLEIINYLINQQCNMESVDFENIRPIHYVCYYGTGDILRGFIEYKCDLESSDLVERRPIHFACYSENIEIINLLIEKGCELEIEDLMNQTPLKMARKNKFLVFSQILGAEIQNRKIDKILTKMHLKCANECDNTSTHTSEITTFFRCLLTKKFDKDERIGKGGFGEVYKCQESFTGQKFAVKIIDQKKNMRKYIENNINNFTEILIHPRIIKYFGAVEKEKKLFIFMELLSGNSLENKIKSRISAPKVIQYTKQMIEALKFLHERNIVHRDIKPENSLFDDEDNVKLVDFGLSLMLMKTNGSTERAGTFCGTKDYMAPEIKYNDLYTCSVDIWSLGVSVIYMATGKIPSFDKCHVINREYQLPNSLPTDFKELVGEMLIPDPEKRISAEKLLNKFECL